MKCILIFGVGALQSSIIQVAKSKGFKTIGIDPNIDAECKHLVDVFEVVPAHDYKMTGTIVNRYNVEGIITTATDKPLLMMAEIAHEFNLPFFSIETAIRTTDKLEMKRVFLANDIPCAYGQEVEEAADYKGTFPLILKPRDNSGSRGVIFCEDEHHLRASFAEVQSFTRMNSLLAEEFIQGTEYSIEGLHFNGKHTVIQVTEKLTTRFPYNVELEHIQPALLDDEIKIKIEALINAIGCAFYFENCASHTEVKITDSGAIVVIETSPRLGGDFITSHLVPLSSGINMESILLDIAVGNQPLIPDARASCSMVHFFNLEQETVTVDIAEQIKAIGQENEIVEMSFKLSVGERINSIKNSLDRYGYFILAGQDRHKMIQQKDRLINLLNIPKC